MKISILICFDLIYWLPARVTLLSLLVNSGADETFEIHIATDKDNPIEESMVNEFLRTQSQAQKVYSLLVHRIDISGISSSITTRHINRSAFLRIYAFNVCAQFCDRIIYLDSDTLILGSLGELWTEPLKLPLCAIQDNTESLMLLRGGLDKVVLPAEFRRPLRRYFNSGVLLIDLLYWKEKNLIAPMKEIIEKNRFTQNDQDVLNLLFNGKVKLMSMKWNFHDLWNYSWLTRFLLSPFETLLMKPRIIHFVGPFKPWVYYSKLPSYVAYREILIRCGAEPELKPIKQDFLRFPRIIRHYAIINFRISWSLIPFFLRLNHFFRAAQAFLIFLFFMIPGFKPINHASDSWLDNST